MLRTCSLLLFSAALLGVRSNHKNYTDIHQVDFRNFSYPLDGGYGVPSSWRWMKIPVNGGMRIQLVNGESKPTDPDEPASRPHLSWRSVVYGQLTKNTLEQDAVVDLLYDSGGTANWHYLYIYRLKDGEPELMAWLESGSRAYGGLVKVDVRDHLLVLDFDDPSKREGDCCSDGYIRVSYRWQNGRFVEVPPRQYGSLK